VRPEENPERCSAVRRARFQSPNRAFDHSIERRDRESVFVGRRDGGKADGRRFRVTFEDSQERLELINGQASVTNDASQCSPCDFFVVRNDDATMRIYLLSENDVTAALTILFVAEFGQCLTTSRPLTRGRLLTV